MLKKTLAAVGVAGVLLLGSASAAFADEYPPGGVEVIAASPTITPGGSTLITATGLGDLETVFFTVTPGEGATLSSIAFASGAPGSSIEKPVVDGSATTTFTAITPGEYTVSVSDGETNIGFVSLVVAAAPSPSPSATSGALPATGGSVPAAAIWAGVGAVGLGGIAVAGVAARRRTQKN